MDLQEAIDRLAFNDHFLGDDDVGPILSNMFTAVYHVEGHLRRHRKSATSEFNRHGSPVHHLQEAWLECRVDGVVRADDLFGEVAIRKSSARWCRYHCHAVAVSPES